MDIRLLISLANKLDASGAYKQAEQVDKILDSLVKTAMQKFNIKVTIDKKKATLTYTIEGANRAQRAELASKIEENLRKTIGANMTISQDDDFTEETVQETNQQWGGEY